MFWYVIVSDLFLLGFYCFKWCCVSSSYIKSAEYKEEIHDIVQNINSGHRELAIFMADVMVDLVYKNNKKITILIRKNKFKIDGVTYVSSDTILNTRIKYMAK